MAGRHVLAACLLLTSAVVTPLADAQKVTAPPTPPPAAPIHAPPISSPPIYAAPRLDPLPSAPPALVAPLAAAKPDVAAPADASAAYSSAGVNADLPPAPSYSDLCQVAPKPPWCSDGVTPPTGGKN